MKEYLTIVKLCYNDGGVERDVVFQIRPCDIFGVFPMGQYSQGRQGWSESLAEYPYYNSRRDAIRQLKRQIKSAKRVKTIYRDTYIYEVS